MCGMFILSRSVPLASLPRDASFASMGGRVAYSRSAASLDHVMFVVKQHSDMMMRMMPVFRLFCNGCVRFTDARSMDDALQGVADLARAVAGWADGGEPLVVEPEVVITTATGTLAIGDGYDWPSTARAVEAHQHGYMSTPGVCVYMRTDKAFAQIFHTGRVVVTGSGVEDVRGMLADVVLPLVAMSCGMVERLRTRRAEVASKELVSILMVAQAYGVPLSVVGTHVGLHIRPPAGHDYLPEVVASLLHGT